MPNKLPVQKSDRHTSHIMGRRRRDAFLSALAVNGGRVTDAAKRAGYASSHFVRRYRSENEDFAKQWAEALVAAGDVLVAEATRRAVDGVKEAVYYKGDVVGFISKYSDALLMFLLKGARPETYRDNVKIEATVRGGVGVALLPVPFTDEAEWEDESRSLIKNVKLVQIEGEPPIEVPQTVTRA